MKTLLPPVPYVRADRSRVWWHLLWLAVGALASVAMAKYYYWLLVELHVELDVQGHIEFITNVCAKGFAWPPNPGFHWLTWLAAGRECEVEILSRATTLVLGGCWGASVYLTSLVGNSLVTRHLLPHTAVVPSRWARVILAALASVAACVMFPPTVSFLIGSPDNYVGLLSPNVYHNSTLIAAMPFSIAAFGLGVRQLRPGIASSLWVDTLLGWVLVGGALCKPSFAFAFVPAYGLLRLVQGRRHPLGSLVAGLTLALLPVLLLIVAQAWWLATHPEIIQDKVVFALSFPAGWKLFLPDLSAWESFRLALGSFALPLVAYALRPAWLRQPMHQLALVSTVVAFVQFMLVYETGGRAGHGNFTWQVMAANHVLYWVVALAALNWQPHTTAGRVRQVVIITIVALSAINGLFYMSAIGSTGEYL